MRLIAEPGATMGGEALVPGDKSCSHRALILGAMADGDTRIDGLLESDDVLATARAVATFGAVAERVAPGRWRLEGRPWQSPDRPVDCGNSGTAARLLMGAVAGMEGVTANFTGDDSLSARPMGRVTRPLEQMGASFEGSERLPVTVRGARLGGIEHRNVPASAQVKSAILLAGLGTDAPVRITEPVASRDHSEIMLRLFGADVARDGDFISLGERRTLRGCAVSIAADPSSAAFPLLAGAIVPGASVTVRNLLVNPLRTGFYETLEEMGAVVGLSNERIDCGEVVADVTVGHAELRPCHVAGHQVPAMIDEIPALAVACAFADGESVIEGLSELKVKESDRLGAVVAGLVGCGVAAIADNDVLRIFGRGRVSGGGRVVTHGDHRIAMAFLTMGLASDGPVEVDRGEMIATSFPDFLGTMRSLGARIKDVA